MTYNTIQNVNKKTTIQISKLVKLQLDFLKKTDRESNNLVIRRLLKSDVYFKMDYRRTWEGDTEESTPPVKVIGINGYQKDTLIQPNEIVIQDNEIYILFQYPLENSVLIKFKSRTNNGFTRLYLWQCIYDGYKQIYDEEEASVKKIDDMTEEPKGTYGIWGHNINSLWIEGVYYCTKTKIVELDIGS